MVNGKFLGVDTRTWGAMAAFFVIFSAIFGGLTKVYIRLVRAEDALKHHCDMIEEKADAKSIDSKFDKFSEQTAALAEAIKNLTAITSKLSENTAVLNTKVENLEKRPPIIRPRNNE